MGCTGCNGATPAPSTALATIPQPSFGIGLSSTQAPSLTTPPTFKPEPLTGGFLMGWQNIDWSQDWWKFLAGALAARAIFGK